MVRTGILHQKEIAGDLDRIRPDVVELMAEHFLAPDRRARAREVARRWPVIAHGIDASLGTDVEWPAADFDRRADFLADVRAEWFGEHVAFTRVPGRNLGHLAPLPFTPEAVRVVSRNACRLRDRIPCPLILENIAFYTPPAGSMTETEFLRAVLDETGCGFLLDLNNLYANSVNHRTDARAMLDALPLDRVVEIHLAGGTWSRSTFLDSHATAVGDPVWSLLEDAIARCRPKAVILERDADFPGAAALGAELDRAREVIHVVA